MLKSKKSPIVSWLKLNNDYQFQRYIIMGLSLTCFIQMLFLIYNMNQAPLVIYETKNNRIYQYANRLKRSIDEKDLEKVAISYIKSRFEWKKFDVAATLKGVSPFVTLTLKQKIKKDLSKLSKQFPKDKQVAQVVANINSNVTMEKISITFDQILRVEGVPLITPMELEFKMIKKAPNFLNPFGIYINNITKYQEM